MNSPATTLLSQRLMTSRNRFLREGTAGVYLPAAFLSAVRPRRAPLGGTISGKSPAAHYKAV
jgi:hypothetical protein